MYTWLSLIGPRNRRLVRFLLIRIADRTSLYYDGESQLDCNSDEAKHKPAGRFLGKAFNLLSKGHFLHQIKVTFEDEHPDELYDDEYDNDDEPVSVLLDYLFHNGLGSMLLVELGKITGIQSLKISPYSSIKRTQSKDGGAEVKRRAPVDYRHKQSTYRKKIGRAAEC